MKLIGVMILYGRKELRMDEAQLVEFRSIYQDIFKNKATVAETPDVIAHPKYKRYCQLAPIFYSMMLKKRRETGLR